MASSGKCSRCQGDGKVLWSDPPGSCSNCIGTGDCPTCDGTGICPKCHDSWLTKCTMCDGTGDCPVCY